MTAGESLLALKLDPYEVLESSCWRTRGHYVEADSLSHLVPKAGRAASYELPSRSWTGEPLPRVSPIGSSLDDYQRCRGAS